MATPENSRGCHFLQTARRQGSSTILCAPEASSSPRKPGSLPNLCCSLQTLMRIANFRFVRARSGGSARKSASPFCMSLRSNPLDVHCQADFLLHLKQAARRASRARCLTILSLRFRSLGALRRIMNLISFTRHVIPNSVDEAAFSPAGRIGVRDLVFRKDLIPNETQGLSIISARLRQRGFAKRLSG
jgi:hypothetical protein